MVHFLCQNGPIMAPRWTQDGPKMASWRVLEPLGGNIAPRWSQEGFKGEKVNSFPPCWGPSWELILVIFGTRVDYKSLEEALG